MHRKRSQFVEFDTKMRRTTAGLQRIPTVFTILGSNKQPISTTQRTANDGFQRLLVGCVFHFSHVALGAIGFEGEELFFQ